jgi:hypothetical protein
MKAKAISLRLLRAIWSCSTHGAIIEPNHLDGFAMVTLEISLPDVLAEEAEQAGLLKSEALERMLKSELRRRAGERLLESARLLASTDVTPLSQEEIQAEIDAVRAERRARRS